MKLANYSLKIWGYQVVLIILLCLFPFAINTFQQHYLCLAEIDCRVWSQFWAIVVVDSLTIAGIIFLTKINLEKKYLKYKHLTFVLSIGLILFSVVTLFILSNTYIKVNNIEIVNRDIFTMTLKSSLSTGVSLDAIKSIDYVWEYRNQRYSRNTCYGTIYLRLKNGNSFLLSDYGVDREEISIFLQGKHISVTEKTSDKCSLKNRSSGMSAHWIIL